MGAAPSGGQISQCALSHMFILLSDAGGVPRSVDGPPHVSGAATEARLRLGPSSRREGIATREPRRGGEPDDQGLAAERHGRRSAIPFTFVVSSDKSSGSSYGGHCPVPILQMAMNSFLCRTFYCLPSIFLCRTHSRETNVSCLGSYVRFFICGYYVVKNIIS